MALAGACSLELQEDDGGVALERAGGARRVAAARRGDRVEAGTLEVRDAWLLGEARDASQHRHERAGDR